MSDERDELEIEIEFEEEEKSGGENDGNVPSFSTEIPDKTSTEEGEDTPSTETPTEEGVDTPSIETPTEEASQPIDTSNDDGEVSDSTSSEGEQNNNDDDDDDDGDNADNLRRSKKGSAEKENQPSEGEKKEPSRGSKKPKQDGKGGANRGSNPETQELAKGANSTPPPGGSEAASEAAKQAAANAGANAGGAAAGGAAAGGAAAGGAAAGGAAAGGAAAGGAVAGGAAAGGAAAGGAAAAGTAAGVAAGPVGWIILAVGIIAKICKWIKDHPYESIATGVVCCGLIMMPVILPVVVIYALIQALFGWLAGFGDALVDIGYELLENVTWGLVDFDTKRDVSEYMSLLDDSDDKAKEYEDDNKEQVRDMMLDMYDMTNEYFDELYDKTTKIDSIELPENLQDSKADDWINLSQKEKNKYLATTVYGLSEELLEELYYGEIKDESKEPAKKLEKGKVYTRKDGKEYKHDGKEVERGNLIAYYDMLGSRYIDHVALDNLIGFGTYKKDDVSHNYFNESDYTKKNSGTFSELDNKKKDEEIKRFLTTRLTAYVASENYFWDKNGDENVDLVDVAGLGLSPGLTKLNAVKDIADKAIFDNNGIKTDDYRVLETKVYEGKIAFTQDNSGGEWKLNPLAAENAVLLPTVKLTGRLGEFANGFAQSIVEWAGGNYENITANTNAKTIYKKSDWASFNIPMPFNESVYDTWFVVDDENNADYDVYYGKAGKWEYLGKSGVDVDKFLGITVDEKSFYIFGCGDWRLAVYDTPCLEAGNTYKCATYSVNEDKSITLNAEQSLKIEKVPENQLNPSIETDIDNLFADDIAALEEKTQNDLKKEIKEEKNNDILIGIDLGYKINLLFESKETDEKLRQAQNKVMSVWKDGSKDGHTEKALERKQRKIDEALAGTGYSVDINDKSSVESFLNSTGASSYVFLDERELIKPYGIPSAFSYFVPLEESTRNIPFLIALAQEMKNTQIVLTEIEGASKYQKIEKIYDIVTAKVEDARQGSVLDKSKAFDFAYDFSVGHLGIRAFGVTILDIMGESANNDKITTFDTQIKLTPIREVIYARLWDREIFNEFVQVKTSGIVDRNGTPENEDDDKKIVQKNAGLSYAELFGKTNVTYFETVDYILANQFVEYNDTPYDLIKNYNVSQADVGIYEEITGRPFLNQYVYEKIQNITDEKEKWAVEEWKDALKVDEMVSPIDNYFERFAVRNGILLTTESDFVTGYKYFSDKNTSSNIYAVLDGEVIAVEPLEVMVDEDEQEEAQYSRYVILYHEKDKTYSIYSHLSSINDNIKVGTKVSQATPIGKCYSETNQNGALVGELYFEYRQGGGEYKDFWAATPLKVPEDLMTKAELIIKAKEEANGEKTPDGSK